MRALALDLGNRAGSVLVILLLAPVFLAVALAVRLSGPGPIVYRQTRIGQYGRPFTIYKFRTMRAGADRMLETVLHERGQEVAPFFKVRDDPRVTRVGAVLRRLSLDELPQLMNVVRGDMNLVGPRPQSPAEVATYDARTWRRLLLKPGMTGLWQVSGRSELDSAAALEIDLEYVRDWTPALDLRILARTPSAVFLRRGAC